MILHYCITLSALKGWFLMAEFEKKVRNVLKQNGWEFYRRGKGDHDIWINPDTNYKVTVDGVIKSRHTANGIMKQAKINHKF